jgi:prolyl oligopeptidase
MNRRIYAFLMIFAASVFAASQTGAQPSASLEYPGAQTIDQTDDFFGTKIVDPYRWLEKLDSPETRAWIDAENKLTSQYLAAIPQREKIRKRLGELWNYERYTSGTSRFGKNYFYTKNNGLQNQSVLYIAKSMTDPGRVFFDPNTLSKDGTTSLATWSVSEDGKLFAYALREAGSDWWDFRIRDVELGKDFPEVLTNIKLSGAAWTIDNKGFFYSRYPEPEDKTKRQGPSFNQALYYHAVGTAQTDDVLIYERPDDKDLRIAAGTTEDGRWLFIYVYKGGAVGRQVYLKDLKSKNVPVTPLVDKFEAFYSLIGSDGQVFYFLTDRGAPNRRLMSVDVTSTDRAWKEIIPEAKETLNSVGFVNNQFTAVYAKDAFTQVRIYEKDGKFVRNVELPGVGTAGGFGGRRSDTVTYYGFSNYTTPNTHYRYEMKTGKSELYRKPSVAFDPSGYEVKQIFYTSKDGTRVPMFIAHKKGMKLDGTNPTILSGYGGFGDVSQRPYFEVPLLVWMEMGGVYAAPNIRGGGEYGEEWHRAGMKDEKQNTFDDFIAASEWLVASKYTQPKKLAITGTSNGGLLVGAVLNQRPELFGAAIPSVGVMDMLRFHKFTSGKSWLPEYGSPDVAQDFKNIYAYSPLHNIRANVNYPAVLVTTAEQDDRVVPAHSFKYTAALQRAQAGGRPVLIRIETNSGHGASSMTKEMEEVADKWAFLVKELDMRIP